MVWKGDFLLNHYDIALVSCNKRISGLKGFLAADEILGRENPFSKLYSPSRKLLGPPALPPINLDYVKNTVTVGRNWL